MIKVHLILGFLGAGKTTFLKALLNSDRLQDEQVLLIVNDFGPENYDAGALSKEGVEIAEITNGCLCCAQTDQFEEILSKAEQRDDIDRIFIEPSGLFIPDQVVGAFNREDLKSRAVLQPIFTILDMPFLANANRPWPPAISRFIEHADFIVKNKTDLVSGKALEGVAQKVSEISDSRLIEFSEALHLIISAPARHSAYPTSYDDAAYHVRFEYKENGLQFPGLAALEQYFSKQAPLLIRSKGKVMVGETMMDVNYTESGLNVSSAEASDRTGITLFYMTSTNFS